MSPAIPTLRAIKDHVSSQFASLLARGKRHGKPDKTKDVAVLIKMYQLGEVHIEKRGRTSRNASDKVKDVMTAGAEEILGGSVIKRWWDDRRFPRSTDEIWENDQAYQTVLGREATT